MNTVKEWLEFAGLMIMATVGVVVYLALVAVAIAVPFIAFGCGIALAFKIGMWIVGWPT